MTNWSQSGETMNLIVRGALCALFCSLMFAADSAMTIGQIHDRELSILERELVPLAEAMPADKYDCVFRRCELTVPTM